MSLTKVTQFLIDSDTINIKDFGAVGDGTIDDTSSVQSALNYIGAVTAAGGTGFRDISTKGYVLLIPAGDYLITDTLYVPSNMTLQGVGMGSKFKFDPSSAKNFMERKNDNTGGSALNRSNFSMSFENFLVYAASDGGSTSGHDGITIGTVNSNTRSCFYFEDVAFSSFKDVFVLDFWYGTAFDLNVVALYGYYNYLLGCRTRNCKQSVKATAATQITDCSFGVDNAFPPPSIASSVQYAVELARGSVMQGGAIEARCSNALIKTAGNANSIFGVYLEAFTPTPAMVDCSEYDNDTGGFFMAGYSYGFTPNVLLQETITRTGSSNLTLGVDLGYGACDELEVQHSSTRQSPSFYEGLPGIAHVSTGGTFATSTDSFIGNTSIELSRGAGTAATANQVAYDFKVKKSNKVLSNIWVTALVKVEGGENNFDIFTFDSVNSTATLRPFITFNNGWVLYATYLKRIDNASVTFSARQKVGSTDSSQKVKFTALRVYTNGLLPIPSAYKFLEYRTAAPTTGTWLLGDIVYNSSPSAGGYVGWVCTTAGSPGTWKTFGAISV